MSKLPVSWSAIPLGQEIEFKKGQKPKFLYEMSNEGLVPYIDIKAFEKGNIRRYADCNSGVIAEANDTLMVWDGARSGLVGNGIAGVIGSTLMRIRPMSSNRNYLHQFLKFKFSQINSNTKGTGIPHVSPEFLFDIDIPLATLPEQRRIADKLDAVLARVDACRDRLDRIPTTLKRFRQSVLSAATSGNLTEEWRAEQVAALQSSVWQVGTLANLLIGKPRNGYSPRAVEYKTSVKSLTLTATTSGRFKGEHFKYIDEEISQESHLWLQPGDILIQRANTLESVGVSAVFDGPPSTYIYPDLMMKAKANELVKPKFLHYLLLSEPVRRHFRDNATGTAGNMPKINQPTVLSAPVTWPSLEEQTEIVRRVEALFAFADRLEARHATARAQVEKLTPATLARAFRGELVPQDPNDEPASKLLERIRANSTSMPTKSGQRKQNNKEQVS